jgi:hypothetical protein
VPRFGEREQFGAGGHERARHRWRRGARVGDREHVAALAVTAPALHARDGEYLLGRGQGRCGADDERFREEAVA